VTRIYIDDYSINHVINRIKKRITNEKDQAKILDVIKQLSRMEAPAEAVGHYMWYVNVERIGRIIFRGHSIRTVYSFNENFPGGTEYRIRGGQLVRA